MIHLFILPGDNKDNADAERAIKTVPLVAKATILPHRKLSDQFVEATFLMYLYDNEFLSKELWRAIPVVLLNTNYHFYSFYHRKWDTNKFSIAPRIFANGVKINDDLSVKNFEFLTGEKILDGFIEAL